MSWSQALSPMVVVIGMTALITTTLDRKRTWVRVALLAVYWALMLRYFHWRATASLPVEQSELLFGVAAAFLAAELTSQLVAQVNYGRAMVYHVDRSEEATRHAGWWGSEAPLVDVFIPTYNESREILEKTIIGAVAQTYPNYRVWLLDDGRRDWLKLDAKRWGVGYLCRNDNEHYKAGNLNHALAEVEKGAAPSFVAVFDADFVPRPRFLERTVSLMHDQKVALVQTPQEFYNPDPFQHAFGTTRSWPDDLRFLFQVRLGGLDGLGHSSCCGTSFLIRKSSLDAIGGFPTESVAEDLLTAMKLKKLGLRCIFLGETLSTGLAAEGLAEHLTQRSRWALGLIEVARSPWGPSHGAPWPLNWIRFADFGLKWCLPQLMRNALLWAPIVALYTGFAVVVGEATEAAYYILPMIAHRMALSWLERGATVPVFSDAINLLPSTTVLRASFTGLFVSGARPFKVTDKGAQRTGLKIHYRVLWYFALVFLLTAGALVVHYWFRQDHTLPGFGTFSLYWCFCNLFIVALASAPCFERPKYRGSERFVASEPVRLTTNGVESGGTLRDLSTTGASIVVSPGSEPSHGRDVTLEVSDCPPLSARVVRQIDDRTIALHFDLADDTRRALIRKLYCSDRYIIPATSWHAFGAWQGLFRWAFG